MRRLPTRIGITPLANVVLADVREQDAGSASGVLNTGFQPGKSIGLALMGVILMLALPARRRPNTGAAAVTEYDRQESLIRGGAARAARSPARTG